MVRVALGSLLRGAFVKIAQGRYPGREEPKKLCLWRRWSMALLLWIWSCKSTPCTNYSLLSKADWVWLMVFLPAGWWLMMMMVTIRSENVHKPRDWISVIEKHYEHVNMNFSKLVDYHGYGYDICVHQLWPDVQELLLKWCGGPLNK